MSVIRLVKLLLLSTLTLLLTGFTPEPSLEAKIGQMLLVGFRGQAVDEQHFIVEAIRNHNLGGVILFDRDVVTGQRGRNIASPEQLTALIADLQRLATVPLLVAVDQEGGKVARMQPRDGFPPSRSHWWLGQQDDLQLTFVKSSRMATALKQAGVGINLAPVVDLCRNPENPVIARLERCFSADPEQVTQQARSFISAHRQLGVLTALKHFPGHGSSREDSHLGLVDVSQSWSATELVPYRHLIAAGLVDAVLTAHVYNARLDENYPATLSEKTITGVLRKQLGFDGVVISDDLQMQAIVDQFGLEMAVGGALNAGVDILLFGNNLSYDEQLVPKLVAIIQRLVKTGAVTEARIDESYRRIMQLKGKVKLR